MFQTVVSPRMQAVAKSSFQNKEKPFSVLSTCWTRREGHHGQVLRELVFVQKGEPRAAFRVALVEVTDHAVHSFRVLAHPEISMRHYEPDGQLR